MKYEWDDIRQAVLHDLAAIQAEYPKSKIEKATAAMERQITRMNGSSRHQSSAIAVVNLRDSGWTMKEIAEHIHLSYGRVQQICLIEANRRDQLLRMMMKWV